MLGALAWSALPAVFLGRAKQPLARELHDKVLFAEAEINRADWLTAGAGLSFDQLARALAANPGTGG